MDKTENFKFESLDALRFFAFFRVFLLHVAVFGNFYLFNLIKNGGEIGVCFFFTLSGFLITYILSAEKKAYGKVNGKRFMIRRVFRIWPLYFFGILLSIINIYLTQYFHLGNSNGYMPNWFYSFAFLENYKMLAEDYFPNGAPLRIFWSLCVEEQFYLLWIIVFYLVDLKNISKVFLLFIIIAILYRYFVPFYHNNTHIIGVDIISNLDYFCIGGFLGLFAINKNFNHIIFLSITRYQFPILIFGFLFLCCSQFVNNIFNDKLIFYPTIVAIIFTLFISIFIIPKARFTFSTNAIFSKLGKLTFGLYVFHTPVILVCFTFFKLLNIAHNGVSFSLFLIISFIISVLISYLSCRFFESYFLKIREKFNY